MFRVENFFEHNFLHFIFSEWQPYILEFFSLKNVVLKKYFPNFFFQKCSFGPPYGCFFFLWGTKGSCSRFELQQSCICALHCVFQGGGGGSVFWSEIDFLKRVNLSLGVVLTPYLSIP